MIHKRGYPHRRVRMVHVYPWRALSAMMLALAMILSIIFVIDGSWPCLVVALLGYKMTVILWFEQKEIWI